MKEIKNMRIKTMNGTDLPCGWLYCIAAERNGDHNTEEQDYIHLRPDHIMT